MIETSGEGGSAWLTPPLGGINSSLKEREGVVYRTNGKGNHEIMKSLNRCRACMYSSVI